MLVASVIAYKRAPRLEQVVIIRIITYERSTLAW